VDLTEPVLSLKTRMQTEPVDAVKAFHFKVTFNLTL